MASISPNPSLQDLKLTFHESTLVAIPPTETRTHFFLSNVDQNLNCNVPSASFFLANLDYPPPEVARRLKSALQKLLLGPYYFMAGRLNLNRETARLEIGCNGAGAGFVTATSKFSLDEIRDLVRPNHGFQQLAVQPLPNLEEGLVQPLCIIQVTSFKCGGFAIGTSVNHILFDGLGAKCFTENLASQAFDSKPLAEIPCLDRRLLSARSLPRVSFPHPQFFKPDNPPASGPPVFDCKKEELESRVQSLQANPNRHRCLQTPSQNLKKQFLQHNRAPPLALQGPLVRRR